MMVDLMLCCAGMSRIGCLWLASYRSVPVALCVVMC